MASFSQSSSSTSSSRVTGRRRQHSVRLDWPGGNKKLRRQPPTTLLWTDKYAPQSSKDLCVADKRVKLVREWIESKSNGLLVLVGSPGVGKSTMVHLLASETKRNLLEYKEPLFDARIGESALGCFEDFLRSVAVPLSGLPSKNSSATNGSTTSQHSKDLILLDELPYMHDAAAESRFRKALETLLHHGGIPAILVYSDTVEGKANTLDRLVPPNADTVSIHPPTKARFGKILKQIMKKERIPAIDTNELHEVCHGDLRFALQSLQCGGSFRDSVLTPFHSLGKILYAKRDEATGELMFDPEHVLEQSGMDLARALYFVQHHTVDFYTDVDDLSNALEYFSDASMMESSVFSRQSGAHPGAMSLTSRTVAVTNRHPASTKFRHLSSPPIYEVLRKKRENAARIPSTTYALDILPLAQRIRRCPTLTSFLDSHGATGRSVEEDSHEAERAQKEQMEILKCDDIVEDDDSV